MRTMRTMRTNHLLIVPSFATPLVACTGQRMAKMSCFGFVGPRERVEHCGGCGYKHAKAEVHLFAQPTPYRQALRAAGRKRAHVAGTYTDQGFMALAVSTCCRDARREARWLHPQLQVSTAWLVDQTEAEAALEAAAEAASERSVSAAALGL